MNQEAAIKGTAIDPVCGMEIGLGNAHIVTTVDGKTYYFCAEACRKTFEHNPKKFLDPKPVKRKGPWGRYLERLNRCTGGKGMKCH